MSEVTGTKAPKVNRFLELEGLRGVAAVAVVLFHAILMFYPGIFYGPSSYGGLNIQNLRYEDNLYGNPIMGFLTGSFSVAIFFVLSGFVLSVSFFRTRDASVIKRLAAKRYMRLMLPALTSILLAYFLIKVGFSGEKEQVVTLTHSSWLAGLWLQVPHFKDALVQGLWGVFAMGESSYNPVLWTIKIELIGSFVVFAAALLFSESKYRWLMYAILALIFSTSWYLSFIVGMAIADWVTNYRNGLKRIPSWLLYIGGLLGVGLGAFPPTDLSGTIYRFLLIPTLSQTQNLSLYLAIGAALVILAVIGVPKLNNFFSDQKVAFLGKYTFALYLIHMPVLFTIGAMIFTATYNTIGFHGASIVAMAGCVLVLVPVVYLFEKYIDAPAIIFSSVLADMYSGKKRMRFPINNLSTELVYVRLRSLYNTIQLKYKPVEVDGEER